MDSAWNLNIVKITWKLNFRANSVFADGNYN
jgi:hypothetical protein